MFRALTGLQLLCVDLPACRAVLGPSGAPVSLGVSTNRVAFEKGFTRRVIRLVPWNARRRQKAARLLFLNLKLQQGTLMPNRSDMRGLYKEGDSSDAFLVNVINPVCTVLRSLVKLEYAPHLRIEVQSQTLFSQEELAPDGKPPSSPSSPELIGRPGLLTSLVTDSFTDHTIMLVSRTTSSQGRPLFKTPILVIEHKLAGIVNGRAWRDRDLATERSDERKLLAQLLLYAVQTHQPHLVLTDYLKTVMFRIDNAAAARGAMDKEIDVSFSVCSNVASPAAEASGGRDPSKMGVRYALWTEAATRLFELGRQKDGVEYKETTPTVHSSFIGD
ncbi:hypothetical protein JCM10212_001680 [Sporobolomyces blumeae]